MLDRLAARVQQAFFGKASSAPQPEQTKTAPEDGSKWFGENETLCGEREDVMVVRLRGAGETSKKQACRSRYCFDATRGPGRPRP
jgi:hypothetical protein